MSDPVWRHYAGFIDELARPVTKPTYEELEAALDELRSRYVSLAFDDRWKTIAFCRTCEPLDGYYCTKHREDDDDQS